LTIYRIIAKNTGIHYPEEPKNSTPESTTQHSMKNIIGGAATNRINSMPARSLWSRNELLLVFRLYCRTPFGKLHQHNPEIIDIAQLIGRTPSAVAMKACNFASLDPVQQSRDISALGHVSKSDRDLWMAFELNSEEIAAEAETVYSSIIGHKVIIDNDSQIELPEGPTEVERVMRTRRVQAFFRATVLTSYEYRCALSGITVPELLNASHIIPWKDNITRRADPRNGIVLNALYDRAFDRGFITFDKSLHVVVSERLKGNDPPLFQQYSLLKIEGQPLHLPYRFTPDPDAISYHREHVFK
jgi:hypothetical protein